MMKVPEKREKQELHNSSAQTITRLTEIFFCEGLLSLGRATNSRKPRSRIYSYFDFRDPDLRIYFFLQKNCKEKLEHVNINQIALAPLRNLSPGFISFSWLTFTLLW